MFEKRWAELPPQSLIANGTADGQLQILDAYKLRVKQIIFLKSNTQLAALKVQVKRVIAPTIFFVGRLEEDIDDRVDVSAYTVADAAFIFNTDPNQPRPKIGPEDWSRAIYEEEPVVALRTVMVDRGGRFIGSSADAPFYVQLSDGSVNIGTVHAQLEMFLSHKDNDPDAGDVHSSLRIGDGVDELEINPDGSINVNLTLPASIVRSTYNEIAALAASTPTLLVSYTAPVGKITYLHRIFVSGDNIAVYKVKLNGTVIETLRTYFGGALNSDADFVEAAKGKTLAVGDVISVEVEHMRPFVAGFNGRIQVIEV